jgi:hypothetical protein
MLKGILRNSWKKNRIVVLLADIQSVYSWKWHDKKEYHPTGENPEAQRNAGSAIQIVTISETKCSQIVWKQYGIP